MTTEKNPRTGNEVKEGDLRVWYVVNPPANATHIYVADPHEAIRVIDSEANRQLKDDRIFMNAFGLETFEDGEWCEWYSEDGDDIDGYREMLEEQER
jgi:hypothetical protein